MIIVSRIIHVIVDSRLNVTNKFKYQRRLSSRLPIVMFRGTPCTCFKKPSTADNRLFQKFSTIGFIWSKARHRLEVQSD